MDDARRAQFMEEMDKVFSYIPAMECKGLCEATCGQTVTMTGGELVRLAGARPTAKFEADLDEDGYWHLHPTQDMGDGETMRCRALEYDTLQCSVYADRPAACRAHYVVKDYGCPHGCKPERYMTEAEYAYILVMIFDLSARMAEAEIEVV